MALPDKILPSHTQAPVKDAKEYSNQKLSETASASSTQQGAVVPALVNQLLPQDATRPHSQYQSRMQNTGITAGAVVGAMGEGSMVGDMMVGGVVGGIVEQRVAQAQSHAFYRDQALQYREGRVAGEIPPPEEVYKDSSKSSWWSRDGRAQRRAERWERRAERWERRAKRSGEI